MDRFAGGPSRSLGMGSTSGQAFDEVVRKLEEPSQKPPGLDPAFNAWGGEGATVRGRGQMFDIMRKNCPPDVADLEIRRELKEANLHYNEGWLMDESKKKWKDVVQPDARSWSQPSSSQSWNQKPVDDLDPFGAQRPPGFAMDPADFPPL